MTDQRPSIHPLVVSELIDAVPTRVRKRLDKDPRAADAWNWSRAEHRWSVACGEETVTIETRDGIVAATSALECSCLLSPRCFHVLACASVLATAAADEAAADDETAEPSDARGRRGDGLGEAAPSESHSRDVTVTEEMRDAACGVEAAVAPVLLIGAKHAGLLIQATLLRSGHACRSAGLVNLGNATLRIVEGIQRFRGQQDTADGPQLMADVALALELSHAVRSAATLAPGVIGQARRVFEPVEIRKLRGICAEPILTLSGYAGVCVYLQDGSEREPRDGQSDMYAVNELRTGGSQLVSQAYRGGIDLGTLTLSASDLCRGLLAVQGMTASSDGRLGKGRATRWAVSSDQESGRLRAGRFARPLDRQVRRVLELASSASDHRPAGWDLVAFDAVIIGPRGPDVLAHIPGFPVPCRLAIAVDDPELSYRDNLTLLGRAPGLRLRCLGRVQVEVAGRFQLLAIVPGDTAGAAEVEDIASRPAPVLEFPESWRGLCNIGVDPLQRHHVRGVERFSEDVVLSGSDSATGPPSAVRPVDDNLTVLRRRLLGLVLGGRSAVPAPGSRVHSEDLRRLRACFQRTAASLLDDLSAAAAQTRSAPGAHGTERGATRARLERTFQASNIYLRAATMGVQRAAWEAMLEEDLRT